MRAFYKFVSIAATFLLTFGVAAKERNWQQSTDTQTQISVRDKNEGTSFSVTFRIKKPDGSTVDRLVASSGGSASIMFPQGFGLYPPLPHGTYYWEGLVGGKAVAADEFAR